MGGDIDNAGGSSKTLQPDRLPNDGCKGCHVDVCAVVLSKARANHRAESQRSYHEGPHRCSERTAWFIRFWENAPLPKMLTEGSMVSIVR